MRSNLQTNVKSCYILNGRVWE